MMYEVGCMKQEIGISANSVNPYYNWAYLLLITYYL